MKPDADIIKCFLFNRYDYATP